MMVRDWRNAACQIGGFFFSGRFFQISLLNIFIFCAVFTPNSMAQRLDDISEQTQFVSALNSYRYSKALPPLLHDATLDKVMLSQIGHSVKLGRFNLNMSHIQDRLKHIRYPFLSFGVRAFAGIKSGRAGFNYLLSLTDQPITDDILSSKVTHIGVTLRQDRQHYPYWMIIFVAQLPPKQPDMLISKQFLGYFNAFRQRYNLPEVRLNTKLYQASLSHVQDMASNRFIGHTGSNGSDVGGRVTQVGYMFLGVAENVAVGYTTPFDVLQAWKNSPGHLKNMLRKHIKEIGIAVIDGVLPGKVDHSGRYWVLTLGWQKE